MSAVLVALSVWILNMAKDLGVAAEGTAMGSGVWPSMLAYAMIVLAAVLALATLISSLKEKKSGAGENEESRHPIDFKSKGMKRVYILLGIFVVFAILLKYFGFYISLVFLIPATMVLLGERRPMTIIVMTAAILVFVYLVFVLMLNLRLPKGSLLKW